MRNNNIFFVKNKEIAFKVDANAKKAIKDIYCCFGTICAKEPGFLVTTAEKKRSLGRQGIIVSSTLNCTLT